jgi:hypothetical protein
MPESCAIRSHPTVTSRQSRTGAALAGARAYQFALELGQPGKHCEYQAAVRGRGVRPGVPEGAKTRPSSRQQRVCE